MTPARLPTPRIPRSTYRLQLTADFTMNDAAATGPYLRDLGADWFYLSPILQAGEGSTHGYDVVDHARVDVARGGHAGLQALATAARDSGLGVLVDIVPNHVGVAVPAANAWWWDVLTHGTRSHHADWFDIDWEAGGGKVRLPVLGETLDAAAASGALRVEGDTLLYHEHRFPLAEGTGDGSAIAVHARQHYELIDWRRAGTDLNYRRFFAVNELAGIRVERADVFAASHAAIIGWVREGLVDGLRIDHPDGLAQPGAYLDRLAAETGGCYVVVEKILESGEVLPPSWATAGTTGYDALADIDRVLIDPAGRPGLDRLDRSLRPGTPAEWSDLIHDTKRGVADVLLSSEVRRLASESGIPDSEDALAELLACFPVYRSYLPYGAEHLEDALSDAATRRPELAGVLTALRPVLGDPTHPAAVRFQQTSGMVMAKGVEDTAFYRLSRLATLTEVGGDPDVFAIGVGEFHDRQRARLAEHPAGMTALTTHDTKRGEDTRARISVLAELPGEWADFVARRRPQWGLGDGAFENVLWQSIVGSWPRDREALHGYAEKAAREAGSATTWAAPDAGYEKRLHRLVDGVFDDAALRAEVEAFVARIVDAGWSNALSAKLLQLSGPGVPDVYQGSELWEFSLVDPDNRRPVDFAERRRLLAQLDDGTLPPVDATGAAKLLITSRTLRARRDRPGAFTAYRPLPVTGAAAPHLVAADRGGAVTLATRLPVGLTSRGGWGETSVVLPEGVFRDAFTGDAFAGETRVADVLARYPVALLMASE